ncbi:MAG: hypothetical protein ACK42Y_06145 [Candidatus Thermochlorobacter sp.]
MKAKILSLVLAFLMFGTAVQGARAQDAEKILKEMQDLREQIQERREKLRELYGAKANLHEAQREMQQSRQNLRSAIKADDKAAIETALKQWREAKMKYNIASCAAGVDRQKVRQENRDMCRERRELGYAMRRGNWGKR